MRHAVFVLLLALASSSLSLTAEARWHHWHYHRHLRHHAHHWHVRHHGHRRHPFYYLHARRSDHHRQYNPLHAGRRLPPAPAARTPLIRQAQHGQGPAYASAGQHTLSQQRDNTQPPKPPAVAVTPAAAAATGQSKAVASTAPAKRVPDWKYPPATIKRVPGGKQHVLAPDTGSFVIIPGYKIVK